MTAYFGLTDVGKIKDGETVVVSGAAGSVGLVSLLFFCFWPACRPAAPRKLTPATFPSCTCQIVTQLALAYPNCKVIAIAGATSKCEHLKDLGCHEVINYKDADWKQQFRKKVKGVDDTLIMVSSRQMSVAD